MDSKSRRERRRRREENKMNESLASKIQKTIENVESEIEAGLVQSSSQELFRRETRVTTTTRSKSEENVSVSEGTYDLRLSSVDNSSLREASDKSKNLTYSVGNEKDESKHETYNVTGSEVYDKNAPVPAPRKRKSVLLPKEKVSSDTDRDVTDIDLDEMHSGKSDKEQKSSISENHTREKSQQSTDNSGATPQPKPRKRVFHLESENTQSPTTKIEIVTKSKLVETLSPKKEEVQEERLRLESGDGEAVGKREDEKIVDHNNRTTALTEEFQSEFALASKAEIEEKIKSKKKLKITDLVEKKIKVKKPKMFSSVIKMEKGKLPKISTITKDAKEDEKKDKRQEDDVDKTDFLIDSPKYPESSQNGRIYVQGKNGFYAVQRDELFKNGDVVELDKNDRAMEDSTVKTAILFQNYWSRSMLYFHGILAGFAFSHVATVTAIMKHFNYNSFNFITIYSCLSLKIHYIFYTLVALCIVSCCDRIDIGHMNRKHWNVAWKTPSMWIILTIYVISFILTFTNHRMEANFDDYLYRNETEILNWSTQNETEARLLTWYHTIWARDLLLLLAWLIISLTRFSDLLLAHLNNMVKYAEAKSQLHSFHHLQSMKTDTL